MTDLLSRLPQIQGLYRPNAPLKNWFNIKTHAEILFRPKNIADLQHFLQNKPEDVPITILGAASNVIIKDSGIPGVTIRFGGEFAQISHENDKIKAGCAALCGNVALYSRNAELSGTEFLTGIPGSIGGAIAMNAGCYGFDVSQTLIEATAIDMMGNLIKIENKDNNFGFSYRKNKLTKDLIFVEGLFKTTISDQKTVADKIAEFNKNREDSQPIRAKTGGSTFKNPVDQSDKKSWQLIDEAGYRGATNNDAQISEKHCNFMINTGKAKAQDLITLGNKAKQAVKNKTNVNLEWEIKILG